MSGQKILDGMTTRLNRRTFLRGSAAVGGAAAAGGLVGSALAGSANPAGGRRAAFASKPIELVCLNVWSTPPGQQATAKKPPIEVLVETFNAKNPGIKVTSQNPGNGYTGVLQKAQAQIAAGNPPALVSTPWANINFAVQGLNITPLETIAGGELQQVLANYKPIVLPLVQSGGKTVGLPFGFSCPIMYYNNDIMKKAGVDPQELFKDWTSFKTLGAKVKAVTGNPILGLGNNADWEAQSIIQCNGGHVLNDKGVPAWDSPEAVAAMQMVADLNKAGLYLADTNNDETKAAFVGGSLAIWMGSVASLGGLNGSVTFDLKTSTFPVFTGKPRKMASGGSFIGCYARAKDQQQASWEFIKFVASKEGTDIWSKTGYLNTTKFEEPVLPGQEPGYTQLNEGLTPESPWPGPRAKQIEDLWATYVARIWANNISAQNGCEQAKKAVEPLLPKS